MPRTPHACICIPVITIQGGRAAVLTNLVVDISYGYFDPRIRYR